MISTIFSFANLMGASPSFQGALYDEAAHRSRTQFVERMKGDSVRFVALVCLAIATGTVFAEVSSEQLTELYSKSSPFENAAPERYLAESENAFAIRDRNPQAPVHVLIIAKKRVPTVLQAPPELIAEMITLAKRVAKQEGLENDGYRLIINTHPNGGQGVYHLHVHVLGGRQMKWPPG